MRVTQRSVQRNYLTSLNRNAKKLADSSQRLNSGRTFSRVSENVSDASRAFKIRRSYAKNQQYLTNIENMQTALKSAENSVLNITNLMKDIEERMVQGMNTGTNSPAELKIIADEINNLKNNMVQTANIQNVDYYVFSGTKNTKPFELIDGVWQFDGHPVTDNNRAAFGDSKSYIDIGFGLKFNPDGTIDAGSVAQLSTSGVDLLGHGTTLKSDGKLYPKNILQLAEKIVGDFANGNTADFPNNLTQLQDRRNELLTQVADVGNRLKFLDENKNRLELEAIDLEDTLGNIESVVFEQEYIYNQSYKVAFEASLKLGTRIIQPSIFDFMR